MTSGLYNSNHVIVILGFRICSRNEGSFTSRKIVWKCRNLFQKCTIQLDFERLIIAEQ